MTAKPKKFTSSNLEFAAPINFETAVKELQAIVLQMESGQMSLEDSLTAYERGDVLLQYCQQALNTVEQKVQLLSEKNTLLDFSSNENNA